MEVYIRKRKSGPPFEVIAALIAGLAIGFAVGYVSFGRGGAQSSVPPQEPVASVPITAPSESNTTPAPEEPVEPTPETPPQGTTPPAPEPPVVQPAEPTAELAKLEDVWPARHLFIAVKGEKIDDETKELLSELKPGGVVLRSENIKVRDQVVALIAAIKDAVGLGATIDSLPLIAVAQEGGKLNVLNLKDAPSAATIGSERDLEKARAAGTALAQSCVDRGIGVLLAPVLDVAGARVPKDVQARCFSDNHLEVAAIGLAYADGVIKGGVLPVVKHFPGMGTIQGDARKKLATIPDDQNRLSELIYPFNEAARCNVPGILVGHVVEPAVDNETKPIASASMSAKFLKRLVRETWGYPGVLLADDISVGAITKSMPVESAAVAALAAGNDAVLMLDPNPEKIRLVCATIEKAAAQGPLDRAALSESKKRLDAWKIALKTPRAGLDGPLPELPREGAAPSETAGQPGAPAGPSATVGEFEYTVAGGDTLSKLANKLKVSADDIRKWNDLKSDNLFINQKLKIKIQQEPPASATAAEPAPGATPAPSAEPTTKPVGPTPATGGPDANAVEPPSEEPAVQPPANSVPVEYIVKSGDFLSSIATQYKVPWQDIMTWNHMNDTKLSAGQKLTIYVPADFVVPEHADATQADTASPGKQAPGADVTPPGAAPVSTEAQAGAAPPPGETEISYAVKKGDNLANIAARYGVTADDIRKWNGIDGNRIDVDQQLKIRPKRVPAE